jgi:serine/threonine-protein kinase mTOR
MVTFICLCNLTTFSQGKNTSAEFLTSLIKAANRLIKPYTLTLLRVVVPKASDTDPILSRCMIECIGILSVVGGEEIVPHVPEIMQVLLTALQDPLTPTGKRDAALLTMGQLCANTSYVVDPLVEHPVLFTIFARLLKTDTSVETRREVLRLLGILGAVDPYMRRKVSLILKVNVTLLTPSIENGPRRSPQRQVCSTNESTDDNGGYEL